MKFGRMVDLGLGVGRSLPHILVMFAPAVTPRPKIENVGNALRSRKPGVTNWPVMTLSLVSHR